DARRRPRGDRPAPPRRDREKITTRQRRGPEGYARHAKAPLRRDAPINRVIAQRDSRSDACWRARNLLPLRPPRVLCVLCGEAFSSRRRTGSVVYENRALSGDKKMDADYI